MLKRWGCAALLLWSPVAWASEVGSARVTSNLFDARVSLDGEYKGTTPVFFQGISEGTHSVRVECAGYTPVVKDIQVEAGKVSLVRTCLQPQERAIMILKPSMRNVPSEFENASLQVSGGFEGPESSWILLGVGTTLAAWSPWELFIRGGLITGIHPTMPYDGLYLEPSLVARHSFTEAIEGYGGLGVRGSMIGYRGVQDARNYWAGNIVLGVWIIKRWSIEARCGVLRNINDPTRKLEAGFGLRF